MPQAVTCARGVALSLVSLVLAVGGCGGSGGGPTSSASPTPAPIPTPLEAGVYLTGNHSVGTGNDRRFYPCYWLNGRRVDLDVPANTDGVAGDIQVSGSDLYIAGATRLAGGRTYHPCYWRNQQRVDLSELDPKPERPPNDYAGLQLASSIWVSGSDVYVTGETASSSGGLIACYWHNGTRTDLVPVTPDNHRSHANDVHVWDGELFIAGGVSTAAGVEMPCYWRNGARADLGVADAAKGGTAGSIAAAGGVVYVSGSLSKSIPITPCYWKDGVRVHLPLGAGIASGSAGTVLLDGEAVYISGNSDVPSGSTYVGRPCYWRNGVRTDLPIGDWAKSGYATHITIGGRSIYITGTLTDDANISYPCYWKDGALTQLAEEGQGGSIAIVVR